MMSALGFARKKSFTDDDAPFELVAVLVAIVVAALATAALFPRTDPGARLVLMAIVGGVLAGWVDDWRVAVAVVVAASLIYVGFLTHRYGELVGDPAPWKQTTWLIGAGVAGRVSGWPYRCCAWYRVNSCRKHCALRQCRSRRLRARRGATPTAIIKVMAKRSPMRPCSSAMWCKTIPTAAVTSEDPNKGRRATHAR